MRPLDYEPAGAARSVLVQQDAEVTRIVVLMHGLYAPVPGILTGMDFVGLVILPFLWIGSLLIRSCFRLPKPPRAVFEVTGEQMVMILRDPFTGETSTTHWPRGAVREARANRFGPGLWIDVTGHVKDTYLQDLSRETVQQLEVQLSAALRTPSRS